MGAGTRHRGTAAMMMPRREIVFGHRSAGVSGQPQLADRIDARGLGLARLDALLREVGAPELVSELDLSGNGLLSAAGLGRFVRLRTLDLRRNGLVDYSALCAELERLRLLRHLDLRENPLLAPSLATDGAQLAAGEALLRHRYALICALPALRSLDGVAVSDAERALAALFLNAGARQPLSALPCGTDGGEWAQHAAQPPFDGVAHSRAHEHRHAAHVGSPSCAGSAGRPTPPSACSARACSPATATPSPGAAAAVSAAFKHGWDDVPCASACSPGCATGTSRARPAWDAAPPPPPAYLTPPRFAAAVGVGAGGQSACARGVLAGSAADSVAYRVPRGALSAGAADRSATHFAQMLRAEADSALERAVRDPPWRSAPRSDAAGGARNAAAHGHSRDEGPDEAEAAFWKGAARAALDAQLDALRARAAEHIAAARAGEGDAEAGTIPRPARAGGAAAAHAAASRSGTLARANAARGARRVMPDTPPAPLSASVVPRRLLASTVASALRATSAPRERSARDGSRLGGARPAQRGAASARLRHQLDGSRVDDGIGGLLGAASAQALDARARARAGAGARAPANGSVLAQRSGERCSPRQASAAPPTEPARPAPPPAPDEPGLHDGCRPPVSTPIWPPSAFAARRAAPPTAERVPPPSLPMPPSLSMPGSAWHAPTIDAATADAPHGAPAGQLGSPSPRKRPRDGRAHVLDAADTDGALSLIHI